MVEQVLKEDGTPYKVAILIPTINNADELDIVLNRLTQQTYPGIEIVISDSIRTFQANQKIEVKFLDASCQTQNFCFLWVRRLHTFAQNRSRR